MAEVDFRKAKGMNAVLRLCLPAPFFLVAKGRSINIIFSTGNINGLTKYCCAES